MSPSKSALHGHAASIAFSAVSALLVVAACGGTSGSPRTSGDVHVSTTGPVIVRPCESSEVSSPPSTAEGGSEITITSFDGIRLRAHWFPALIAPAPTLLQSPGWASAGATPDAATQALLGPLAIDALRERGYNVLTWDRRGFGASEGVVAMGAPDTEGRDVVALIDWIARRPEAQLDEAGDPRLGMMGGSYGGGIQLVAAALDCRIDAIVPDMAWNSWRTSLSRGGIAKRGWINLLSSSALDREFDHRYIELADIANESGVVPPEIVDYLDALGPGPLVDQVNAPTLLLQGTVDSLFTLNESLANFASLQERGVPSAMVWYCGGHGTCPDESRRADDNWVEQTTVAWLDWYVRGDRTGAPQPEFETVDQFGVPWHTTDALETEAWLTAIGTGRLELDARSFAGPALADSDENGMVAAIRDITPARADVAAELEIAPHSGDFVAGTPLLELRYRGQSGRGPTETHAFAQLVDRSTGRVLGDQITPIPLLLDGEDHTTSVDLEAVVFRADDRTGSLTLQIVATTPLYATPGLGGFVEFDQIGIRIPLVDGMELRPSPAK